MSPSKVGLRAMPEYISSPVTGRTKELLTGVVLAGEERTWSELISLLSELILKVANKGNMLPTGRKLKLLSLAGEMLSRFISLTGKATSKGARARGICLAVF